MKNIIITGGNGFIGNALLDKLKSKQSIIRVFIFDKSVKLNKKIKKSNLYIHYYRVHLNKENSSNLIDHIIKKFRVKEIDEFWNLAANSDIKSSGYQNDFNDTYLTCFFSCELFNKIHIKKYIFASTSAIYGESKRKLSELTLNFNPISNYGLMKLQCEKILKFHSNFYKTKFYIFRFPNVVGPNLTHGIIYDFLKKIKKDPNCLEVLGNGQQKKPYLYVHELISIMNKLIKMKYRNNYNIFNISPEDNGMKVKDIAELFKELICPNINLKYSSKNNFGWKGDVSKYKFDIKKIKSLGINLKNSSYTSIYKTIKFYKND